MAGHGWVVPNKDGSVARCGGPGVCKVCQDEQQAMTTPTTSRVSDAQREAFEKWAVANGHPITIRDDGSDKYVSTLTNLRWSGWQAALAQPRTAGVGVPEAIKSTTDPRVHGSYGHKTGFVNGWNACRKAMLAAESEMPDETDAVIDAMCKIVARECGEDFDRLDDFTKQSLRATQRQALRAAREVGDIAEVVT